jgi:hypothetical protein
MPAELSGAGRRLAGGCGCRAVNEKVSRGSRGAWLAAGRLPAWGSVSVGGDAAGGGRWDDVKMSLVDSRCSESEIRRRRQGFGATIQASKVVVQDACVVLAIQ